MDFSLSAPGAPHIIAALAGGACRPRGPARPRASGVDVLLFRVLIDGKTPKDFDGGRLYLTSLEGQPIRARFRYSAEHGLLFCERRSQGLAALNLPWSTRGGSCLMLKTALLPDRDEPYLLPLELARGQVAATWRKKDEWGYVDGESADGFRKAFGEVKLMFARAATVQNAPAAAADLAEEALARAVRLGEQLAMTDARHGVGRRRESGQLARVDFGCHWDLIEEHPKVQDRFAETFNYATLPFRWRRIEPREQEFDWTWHDGWIQWLERKGVAMKGGGMVRFAETTLPDWVWIWENDFETIRDYVFDHIERCVQRYRGRIDHWDAVTGLHVENCMGFSLDQILELSRVGCHAVKRADPSARVGLELIQPWGEYYATNQRSIWPYHYAEMCINAGVPFDLVGLQIFFGTAGKGFHCRDMLAVSDLLDRFGTLGKPVHVTAVGVPSACYGDPQAVVGKEAHEVGAGGVWRKHWDEVVQSDWANEFYHVAISKPFVTAVSWRDFSDHQPHYFPHAGLLRKDLHPKIAYQRLVNIRHEIWPEGGPREGGNVLFEG